MPVVDKTIVINVPPETVFEFIANQPERMPEWWPPMQEQERTTPAPTELGSRSRYVYQMMKIRIAGEHEVKAFVPNEHLNIEVLTGITCTFDFKFVPTGTGATELVVHVEYETPGGIFGKLANKIVIERKNEEDWDVGLANLKRILESGGA